MDYAARPVWNDWYMSPTSEDGLRSEVNELRVRGEGVKQEQRGRERWFAKQVVRSRSRERE